MPIPTGAVYFSQIRSELYNGTGGGYPLAASMPLNDATFRSRLTNTSQNASLNIGAIKGNAYQRFTIAADTVYYNIYNALAATGWNGLAKGSVDVIVNGGIVVSSASTGAYAMDTGGPWPGPSSINLYNYGYILGMGGNGGSGGNGASPGNGGSLPGAAGGGGGPGLLIQRSTYLVNGGIIAGGGGGGGGGDGEWTSADPFLGQPATSRGGGGGGGGASSRYASGGGAGGTGVGTPSPRPGAPGAGASITGNGSAGGGGGIGGGPTAARNDGGAGGSWGAAGAIGGRRSPALPYPQGGGGGISVQGWSAVTAAPSGTLYGSVSG